ncbi:MAG: glutaminyl-peptide cyclotransferase [Candidatus Thermoplasmatota archaeon]|nr:glutaminyl-peptide cyclotransferase [Candidatus Thermoplasmatota archaeon]
MVVLITALFLLTSFSTIGAQGDDSAYVRAESYVVVEHDNVPHNSSAYTQGLEFYQGRLFESTGKYGHSTLREVNLSTGEIIRSIDLNETEFGEGMTFVGDEIIQLTWKEGVAYRYAMETFEIISNYSYEGEGWGLAYDGTHLIMSNGTNVLQFRNASTFELESTLNVTLNNQSLSNINELEMIDDLLVANIYQTEEIVGIDLNSGVVVWHIDASGLRPDGGEVLNGIAFDSTTQSLWITGKYWSKMYNVTFTVPEPEPEPEPESNTEAEEELPKSSPDSPNPFYSQIILVIMLVTIVILLAMNLKDGGRNPPNGGQPDE